MTQQITLIKDKILSDNYFTLHNITYDLTPKTSATKRKKREGKCDSAWTVRPQKFKQTAQVVSSLRR